MEEYFYIILLILWLVVSLYKRGAKGKGKTSQPKPQPDTSTSPPKESDLEEMLEEFFGGGKKKSPQPETEVLEEEVVVAKRGGDDDSNRRSESIPAEREREFQPWESKAQRAYNESKADAEEAASPSWEEASYEEVYKESAEKRDESPAMEKVATVEELIRSHAAKDAMEQARAEMEFGSEAGVELTEFDLRNAVIFAEILNRKYQ